MKRCCTMLCFRQWGTMGDKTTKSLSCFLLPSTCSTGQYTIKSFPPSLPSSPEAQAWKLTWTRRFGWSAEVWGGMWPSYSDCHGQSTLWTLRENTQTHLSQIHTLVTSSSPYHPLNTLGNTFGVGNCIQMGTDTHQIPPHPVPPDTDNIMSHWLWTLSDTERCTLTSE